MKTYEISKRIDDADLSKKNEVLKVGKVYAKISAGLMFPSVGLAMILMNSLPKPQIIEKVDDLEKFTNGLNEDWKKGVKYIEHPRKAGVLVEAKEFGDFAMKEIVADLAGYAMEHLDIKKLVIGVVNEGTFSGKASVPVKQINVDANINCNLNDSYVYSTEHSKASNEENDHCWIKLFPDFVTAVNHKCMKLETIKTVSSEAAFGIEVKGFGNGIGMLKKDYKFYIFFECEG